MASYFVMLLIINNMALYHIPADLDETHPYEEPAQSNNTISFHVDAAYNENPDIPIEEYV